MQYIARFQDKIPPEKIPRNKNSLDKIPLSQNPNLMGGILSEGYLSLEDFRGWVLSGGILSGYHIASTY